MSKGWACIARLGGIGDNLIASSVLRPLKRMGYMTEAITSGLAGAIFLNNPFLDKLTLKEEGDIPTGEAGTKWFISRSKEYDIFSHLSFTCEVHHALQVSQASFWWRPEARRKLCAGSYLETAHDVVGVAHEFGPLFFPTEEEKGRALDTKKRYTGDTCIAWIISGSRLDKIYPYSTMAIHRIIKELNVPVMVVGTGPRQTEMAKAIETEVRRTNSSTEGLHFAVSLEGADPGGSQHWPLRRSLSQVLVSDLVVSPDTGMAWAAAMEPMPKVMLVSHASEDNITKHWVNTTTLHADPQRVPCWPCHRLHNDMSTCTPSKDNPQAAACISDIGVESILQAVASSLRAKSNVVPLHEVAA